MDRVHRARQAHGIPALRTRSIKRSAAGLERQAGLPKSAEDVTGDLDLAAIRRPALEQRRVNADFPSWTIESLDRQARRLGVTR
jgi:hypothetical protein